MNTRVWWIAAGATVALAALGSPAIAAPVEPGGNGRLVPASLRCDHVVDADALVAHLARGGRFLCSGITVQGAVDLTAIGVVQGVVACRGCTFTGRVDGQHVVFERELDLVETTFARDVDFGGAHFEQPVLFGVAATTDRCGALVETGVQPPPEFRRSADFAYATFDDLAVFEGMRFLGKANFTSSRFRAVARIGNAGFCGAASFADASFSREAVFSHATFARVDFAGAVFARPADFRQATFGPTADFSETTFAGRADFSQISVPGSASFASAHFGAGAYFEQVRLGRIVAADWPALAAPVRGPRPLLVFEDASVDGPLTLKGAELFGGVRLNSISARAIVIEQAEFDSRSALFMSDVTAAALSISPDDLAQHLRAPAAAERLAALRMVEATAKTDGNLGRANDARYQIQVLESADDWWPQRVGDAALYRWVAGYFVQPLRPVVWLVVAILVAASLRAVHRQAEDAEQPRKPGRVARAAGRFAAELAYTITPGGDKDQKPPLRRAELTVYAVLLGCFVLSLANTNPTLRQMVEGLL